MTDQKKTVSAVATAMPASILLIAAPRVKVLPLPSSGAGVWAGEVSAVPDEVVVASEGASVWAVMEASEAVLMAAEVVDPTVERAKAVADVVEVTDLESSSESLPSSENGTFTSRPVLKTEKKPRDSIPPQASRGYPGQGKLHFSSLTTESFGG